MDDTILGGLMLKDELRETTTSKSWGIASARRESASGTRPWNEMEVN